MKISAKQRGFALLIFVAFLATAAATVTVKALNDAGTNSQIARDRITAAALAQAKEALIGYALAYPEMHPGYPVEVPGYLPCPDTSGTDIGGEGGAAGICGTQIVSVIGRLPWKTLKVTPLRGGDNECLWYAVSGTYKNNPPTGLMNWDTNGQLKVYASDGTTLLTPADNQAVAVIFAPGAALKATQNRAGTTAPVCGGNYTTRNYLDSANCPGANCRDNTVAAGPFYSGTIRDASGNPLINDRIAFITKQDIWNAMKRRNDFLASLDMMTKKTAECIASFGFKNNTAPNKSLPWPAQLLLSDYSVNANYNDSDGRIVGRVPYKVNTSRSATGNNISSPYSLLQANGANCPNPSDWANLYYSWWNNWKDHLFYAIGQRFEPDNNPTGACDNGHCLRVNNTNNYAAVVIFANQPLTGQSRTDKSNVLAYLEGRNATNIFVTHSSGNENYEVSTTSNIFNDIVYCIKEDLMVVKGNPSASPVCP